MKRTALRQFFCCIVVVSLANAGRAAEADDRRQAIERALDFLSTVATDHATVEAHGFDLLWCFSTIARTSRDPALRRAASRMGRDLARRWRASHRHVPANADAITIYNLLLGAYSADRLGVPDPDLKAELRKAAKRFGARDYLGFDALHEPPAIDDPHRYDQWTDALIRSYFGERYGIRLGAGYADVVKWLPCMRPYESSDGDVRWEMFYSVTHLIYTVDGYHERAVSPSLLAAESAFLKRSLDEGIADGDAEMVGEAIDALKAAGSAESSEVRRGTAYLLSTQNADGSWGEADDDTYTRYHSAWTGIDGLREFRYRGRVSRLPRLVPAGACPARAPTAR